jgi:hypothetical protein
MAYGAERTVINLDQESCACERRLGEHGSTGAVRPGHLARTQASSTVRDTSGSSAWAADAEACDALG